MKTIKLPKAFKKKWLAALRNGEYKQGKGQLFNKHKNTYCCLGVGCAVSGYAKSLDMYEGCSFIHFTAKKVPALIKGDCDNNIVSILSKMNDGEGRKKVSFKGIANWIEKNL